MSHLNEFSDDMLQAYVDGELDKAEVSALQTAMDDMPELKQRVCELQHLKGMVNHAFPLEEPPSLLQEPLSMFSRSWGAGITGVVVGGLVVVLGYASLGVFPAPSSVAQANQIIESSVSLDEAVMTKKIVLHIDSNDAARLDKTVSYAEELLESYGREGVKVEVLVNAGGIDLFNTENSLYRARLDKLSHHYDNLELIACANAISRVRERGEGVHLLPQARTDVTALDHVVKRLQEGWSYLKI